MTTIVTVRKRFPLSDLTTWGLAGAAAGLIAAIPGLPAWISGPLLGFFILVGPGSVVVDVWAEQLPLVAIRALVPIVSLAIVILVPSMLLLAGWWAPPAQLLLLAAATALTADLRRRRHARAEVLR